MSMVLSRQRQQLQLQHPQQEEMLQQNPEAIATYDKILADDDTHTKAIVALDRRRRAWSRDPARPSSPGAIVAR